MPIGLGVDAPADREDGATALKKKKPETTTDATQEAAKLARLKVTRAVEVVADILDKPGRNAMAQLKAAELILELAGQLAPEANDGKPRGELRLVDAQKAALALRKRLDEGGGRSGG